MTKLNKQNKLLLSKKENPIEKFKTQNKYLKKQMQEQIKSNESDEIKHDQKYLQTNSKYHSGTLLKTISEVVKMHIEMLGKDLDDMKKDLFFSCQCGHGMFFFS